MNKPNRAVIFDMDGTIVDNMDVHIDTWLIYLEQHKIDLTREAFLKLNHGNLTEIISRVFQLDKSDPRVMELGQAKEQFYRDTYRGNIVEIPGLTNTLRHLKAQNISCGLATMGDTPNIDLVVDALEIRSFFDSIIGGHQVSKGKPDPQIFLSVLRDLDRIPDDCLVVEDSVSGVKAALNAGIKVVGITTSHSREELLDHGCIETISDYSVFDINRYF
ncbi:MAG: HAD family phosphatase [Flavobacteriaceae bacterium]|nr:HAD family phosphatase [Flavobacteriaceae bacterium]NNK73815.1 HAD family phosphatase [Flavobacteriaceae bacterium]